MLRADLRREFALEFVHPRACDPKGREAAGGVVHGHAPAVAGVWLASDEAESLEVVERLGDRLPAHLRLCRHLAGTRAILAQMTQHDCVTGLDLKAGPGRGN